MSMRQKEAPLATPQQEPGCLRMSWRTSLRLYMLPQGCRRSRRRGQRRRPEAQRDGMRILEIGLTSLSKTRQVQHKIFRRHVFLSP
jgi:hypothetical protein